MYVTRHAYQRGKERLGLKKNSVERMANIALDCGISLRNIENRSLQSYIIGKTEKYDNTKIKLYGEVVYVFSPDDVLITLFQIPHRVRANSLREQRR